MMKKDLLSLRNDREKTIRELERDARFLKRIAEVYPGRTIENIIQNVESRINHLRA